MEVKLDKRYPVAAGIDACWSVLRDIRAVGACMPGAQVTEQIDDSHYKGTVKSKVGPAVMSFGGDIEVQGVDAEARSLRMLGKGADKAGSSASMQLTAHLEPGAETGQSVLVGVATIVVSGKLAQFGSRLLVPVSDAMLAQFADNFRTGAVAAESEARATAAATVGLADSTALNDSAAGASGTVFGDLPARPAAAARPPQPVKELNALALMWTVFKGWLAGLFGRKT